MKKVLTICLLATLVSCKGPKGEKGDSGAQGPAQIPPISSNQPIIDQFSGLVGTGTALIGTALHTNSAVLVYLESNISAGTFVLLSVNQSATDPWCEVSYQFGAVTFHNCAPTNSYKILVITPSN